MNTQALLIIDVQTGNFSKQKPKCIGDNLFSKIKSLIKKARTKNTLIVYVQHNGRPGDPDEVGTAGWKIHRSIPPFKEDLVIQKQFPDSFQNTQLHQELRNRKINKLYIAGLQTEYCVDTTCRRAFSLGYEVVLVEDAHGTWDSLLLKAEQIINHHNQVLSGWFVTLNKTKEVNF
jgi:nicotinamidase-related amidase